MQNRLCNSTRLKERLDGQVLLCHESNKSLNVVEVHTKCGASNFVCPVLKDMQLPALALSGTAEMMGNEKAGFCSAQPVPVIKKTPRMAGVCPNRG